MGGGSTDGAAFHFIPASLSAQPLASGRYLNQRSKEALSFDCVTNQPTKGGRLQILEPRGPYLSATGWSIELF